MIGKFQCIRWAEFDAEATALAPLNRDNNRTFAFLLLGGYHNSFLTFCGLCSFGFIASQITPEI